MKRVPWMIAAFLLFCGCAAQPQPAPVPDSAPSRTEPVTQAAQEQNPKEKITMFDLTIVERPAWHGSEPQEGPAVVPQPGDTATTWDAGRAERYPADSDCTPEQLLEKWLAVEGLSAEDLEDRSCGQLILVAATGEPDAGARVFCLTRQRDGSWLPEQALWNLSGYTGSNGIAHDRQRGTNTSPAGLWAIGSAFGLAPEPDGLKLPWRQITDQSDWVGDAASAYFNTWQERDDPTVTADWDRADSEHLADFGNTYTYACVIEFNTPPYAVPERGFAIFLHVSDHPTQGCIGLLTEDMVRTLLWLDPHQNPHILITGTQMQ